MATANARAVEFRSLKQLNNRFHVGRDSGNLISVLEKDVPRWQRQVVWTSEEMGLLAYSILRRFPIGMVILWRQPNGIRVPLDGRQRLTAIKEFYSGAVAIPPLPGIAPEYHNKKYLLRADDDTAGFTELSLEERETFDDYEPSIVEYDNLPQETAMEIFVKLQGGKSLTKTEVRAALGGRLCDFVSDLTGVPQEDTAEDDEDEPESAPTPHHPFFKHLGTNLKNRRKSHRNVCDILLHEFLQPGQDKHWSSLEALYRDKSRTLTDSEKNQFKTILNRFLKALEVRIKSRRVMIPQMRSAFFILTVFRAWRELTQDYALPSKPSFAQLIQRFETNRIESADEIPWVNFTAALSNAGYAANRIAQRHEILMTFILQTLPDLRLKDDRRAFTLQQKVAVWERANHRCEATDKKGKRCTEQFDHPREADADHVIRHRDGGPTTLGNARLLCPRHNRGRGTNPLR